MDELIAYAQSIINYLQSSGSSLNSASQKALGDLLQGVMSTIEQTSQQGQQEQPSNPESTDDNLGFGTAPSPDVQLLWILAGQQEDAFLNYLKTYPTDDTKALLNNPQELERVIKFLHEMMPSYRQPVVDGIQHSFLNSSNIWGTAYDPATRTMKVRFQGGAEYEYDGVPTNIYRALTNGQANARTKGSNRWGRWWIGKNPSMGAAMNQLIKEKNYPYRKIA